MRMKKRWREKGGREIKDTEMDGLKRERERESVVRSDRMKGDNRDEHADYFLQNP